VAEQGTFVLATACAAEDAAGVARRVAAFDTKVGASICKAMSAFEANMQLQTASLNAIHFLTVGEDNGPLMRKKWFVEEDVLAKVATAMWSFPHSEEIQQGGGAALRALCSGEDTFAEDRKMAAIDAGSLASIVQALTSHTKKEKVQLWNMSAVRAICSHSNADPLEGDTFSLGRKHMAAEEGILSAVIRGMASHSGSEAVQEEGCAALAAICGGEAFICKQHAVMEGAFPAVIKGMKSNSGQGRLQYAGCLAIMSICAGELTDMSPAGQQNTEIRQKAAADAGTLPVVIKALKSHGGNPTIKQVGHAALQSITFNNAKLVALAIKAGAKKEWL